MKSLEVFTDLGVPSVRLTDDENFKNSVILLGADAYEVARWYLWAVEHTKHLDRCPLCDLPVLPWDELAVRPVDDGKTYEFVPNAHAGCMSDMAWDRWKEALAEKAEAERPPDVEPPDESG